MRLAEFHATGVFGYLKLDVVFKPDLTFLVGLNGSGKTTVINLVTALLGPSLRRLMAIPFASACLVVELGGERRKIEAARDESKLTLSMEGVPDPLIIEWGALTVEEGDEGTIGGMGQPWLSNATFRAIADLPNPMCLGIDRRASLLAAEPREERGRRFIGGRRIVTGLAITLMDVQELVRSAMLDIRDKQNTIDEEMRTRIMLNAFSYNPTGLEERFEVPTKERIQEYKGKVREIEKLLPGLRLPAEEIKSRLTSMFDRIEQVREAMQARAKETRKKSSPSRKGAPTPEEQKVSEPIIEWLFNRAEIDRVLSLIPVMEENAKRRAQPYQPMAEFLELANKFLRETHKSLELGAQGLLVRIGESEPRTLDAMSSGERQIVVMLAHLGLNPQVAKGGVFIVDEPELSLHISWQEMFVDAIRKASPEIQLILATHSPSIILERDEYCVSLPGGQ